MNGALPLWQDAAIALGSAVGLLTKMVALADSDTVWTRRSSLVNVLFYPPSIAAFASLGLWLTFAASCLSLLTWTGIAVWRAPDDEDWLGRVD
jgi:hypothetical protein